MRHVYEKKKNIKEKGPTKKKDVRKKKHKETVDSLVTHQRNQRKEKVARKVERRHSKARKKKGGKFLVPGGE